MNLKKNLRLAFGSASTCDMSMIGTGCGADGAEVALNSSFKLDDLKCSK